MIADALSLTDQLLRGTGPFRPAAPAGTKQRALVVLILVGGALYGGVMGTYALDTPQRFLQIVFAGIKTPLLLLATTALCLPAFFVVNTIVGLRDDFAAALRAILAGQAALSIVLASLAPVTHFWYWSEDSYRGALLFNAWIFALAAIGGQVVIRRHYGALIRQNRRHRMMLAFWFALYAFVGIQMGWILRPFIGDPSQPVGFFRDEPFSNAYVVMFRLVSGLWG